jgi:hypothetical protein
MKDVAEALQVSSNSGRRRDGQGGIPILYIARDAVRDSLSGQEHEA